MRKFAALALLIILAAFTAACNAVPATGDTSTDALSAQSQMPPLPNTYIEIPATTLQSILDTTLTGANLTTGNLLGAAAVNRITTLVECFRDVGAVDFKGYASVQEAGGGVVIIINTTRVSNNLLSCISQTFGGRNSGPSAQSAFEPCVKNGTFTVQDNNFTYLYVGTTPTLCSSFQTHFASKGG